MTDDVLAFDDSGGPGPVVVCLPGFSMTRAAMAAAVGPALAGAGLREVYLDPPGHGDSPPVAKTTSDDVLDAVVAWLDAHTNAPVLLAGMSYGGYLSAAIARRRPELVRGLLLICPAVRIGRQHRDVPVVEHPGSGDDWLAAAPPELHAHFDLALGNRTAAVVTSIVRALDSGGPGDEAFLTELQTGKNYALSDETADVAFAGPVSVVTGRQDRIAGYADQYRAMRLYPHGTYTIVDAAGHYLPFEQPALLRALAQNWLQNT